MKEQGSGYLTTCFCHAGVFVTMHDLHFLSIAMIKIRMVRSGKMTAPYEKYRFELSPFSFTMTHPTAFSHRLMFAARPFCMYHYVMISSEGLFHHET